MAELTDYFDRMLTQLNILEDDIQRVLEDIDKENRKALEEEKKVEKGAKGGDRKEGVSLKTILPLTPFRKSKQEAQEAQEDPYTDRIIRSIEKVFGDY